MKYILSFIFLTVSVAGLSQSRTTCIQNLEKAEEEFEHGHLYQVKDLLYNCLQSRGFRNEDKIRAHYLMTRAYLYLDVPDSADYHYLEILKIDPEYEVSEETNPIELVYLAEKFTTSPIISLNVRVGTNMSTIRVINDYDAIGDANLFEQYKPGFGFQVGGIGTQVHFSDQFSFQLSPEFSFRRWRYFMGAFPNQETLATDSLFLRETHFTLHIPMSFRYDLLMDKPYHPYFYGGYALNLLFLSTQNYTYFDREGEALIPNNESGYNNSRTRRFINGGNLVFGAGIEYKWKKFYFFADLQYNQALFITNRNNQRYPERNNSYSDPQVLQFPYVDDDFMMNNVSLSFGFVRPLYKPRLKDRFTLRTFFQEVTERWGDKKGGRNEEQ